MELKQRKENDMLEMFEKEKTVCPECNGTGWVVVNAADNVVRPCSCLLKTRKDNKLRFANIPPKYADKRVTDITTEMYSKLESVDRIKTAIAALKEYIERIDEMQAAGQGLYLYSNAKGSGKTLSACALSNELMDLDKQVKFSDAPTILAEIKRTYEKDTESQYTENKLLDALVTTEILVIDDFGTEKVTDWVNDKFYHIINQRYVNKKVTIYTSNEIISDLDYDKRIKDRVTEMSFVIHYPEESIREVIGLQNSFGLKALCQ